MENNLEGVIESETKEVIEPETSFWDKKITPEKAAILMAAPTFLYTMAIPLMAKIPYSANYLKLALGFTVAAAIIMDFTQRYARGDFKFLNDVVNNCCKKD